MVKVAKRVAAVLLLSTALAGCGYTTKSLLPADIKRIHVAPVKNAIDLSTENSGKDHFRVYRPGLEVELTNAIINRFIFDGNLRVSSHPDDSDAIVEARLTNYRRDALRYTEGDDIEEYRVNVVLDVSVYRRSNHEVIWHDPALAGDTTFFVAGQHAATEDDAAARAVEDAARRVVEKTLELW